MEREIINITFITVMAILLIAIIFINLSKDENESAYILEERVVGKCDTFWGYYCEGYYADMSYDEALYTFKKDNKKQKSYLIEGETVILRKVVN